MKYKYLPHTADVKFIAYGNDLEGCFSNIVLAVTNVLVNSEKIKKKIKKKIKVSSENIESLVYDFINELIFLIDSEGFIPSVAEGISIKEERGFELVADLIGDKYKDYPTHGDVKSATYHEMEVKRTPNGFEIAVVLDI